MNPLYNQPTAELDRQSLQDCVELAWHITDELIEDRKFYFYGPGGGLCIYDADDKRVTEFKDIQDRLHRLIEAPNIRSTYTIINPDGTLETGVGEGFKAIYGSCPSSAPPVIAALPALPPQVSPGSPSLADQNWARRFIQDHETEKASRPNWKPPKAVQDSLAEAQDIIHRADSQTEKDKAAEDLHQRLGYLGY